MNKSDLIWIKLMNFGHRLGCHQMEERSFHFKEYQFPVCARCTGVLIGEIITIVLLILGIKINLLISTALLLIMGFDWFIQYKKLLQSTNIRRLITGTLAGLGLTFIYYYVIVFIINIVISFIH